MGGTVELEFVAPGLRLVQYRILRGGEMRRETCPQHQYWLLLKGEWSEFRSGRRSAVCSTDTLRYMPTEPCRRICESDSIAFGVQLDAKGSRPESVGCDTIQVRTLWQLASRLRSGRLDAFEVSEATLPLLHAVSSAAADHPTWLINARAILHEEADLGATLTGIAKEVGIAPNHLSATFSRHFGMTMSRYRRRMKLFQALRKGDWAEGGFYDASHFSRTCRQELGIGPTTARRLLHS